MIKTVGNCPDCGKQLKRVGHKDGAAKGRYQCVNSNCKNVFRKWFNRSGEPR